MLARNINSNSRSRHRTPDWFRNESVESDSGMLAGATGLEPAASRVTGRRSNQLNYAPAFNQIPYPFLRARYCAALPENPREVAVTVQRRAVTY